MRSFLLLAMVMLTAFFAQAQKFEIIGKLSGFADSTLLYLDNAEGSSSIHIDSTFIINNQFRLNGSLKDEAIKVIVRTKNFSDYKFFWIENTVITFESPKGKFRDAVIIGSKTQALQDQLDAVIKTTGNEKEQTILFINKNPDSIISASILSGYASSWGKDTSTILYDKLSVKNKATDYGKNILEFITLNKDIKVGDKYIDFSEQNIDGKTIRLSDFNGKVTLLEFWGSWCGPCREGNPSLVKTYHEFKNKGFDILGVAADDNKELWIQAVRKDHLSWQNVSELKGDRDKAALIYGVSYYPTNFLIDRNGIIIAKDLRGEDLRKKLIEILK